MHKIKIIEQKHFSKATEFETEVNNFLESINQDSLVSCNIYTRSSPALMTEDVFVAVILYVEGIL